MSRLRLRSREPSTPLATVRGARAARVRAGAALVGIGCGWWAALAFASFDFLLLWPSLTGKGVLSPASVIYDWVPWSAFRPKDIGAYYNRTLSDQAEVFYPWMKHAREAIRAGDLPEWNPYALAGTPFLANPQTALFSPFNVPFWVLPLSYAFGVAAALKLWTAAFGTYLLAREFGRSFWPALLAGLTFGFGPFMIVWLSHPHLNVMVFLPWILWAVERIARRGSLEDALALAAFSGLAFVGGHPGSELHLLLAVVTYSAVRFAVLGSLPWAVRARRLALGGAGLALGITIAAVALVPAALAVPGSAGLGARAGGGGTRPWSTLLTLFFPDWWGRPSAIAFEAPPFPNFNERLFYVGAVPLLLAAVGLLFARDWRQKGAFAALALLGLTIPLGVEPFHWVVAHLPLLDRALNARLHVLANLGVAVLGAFGLEYLLRDGLGPRGRAVAVAGLAVGIGATVAITPTPGTLRLAGEHFATGADFPLPRVLQVTAIGWWMIFAGSFALVLLAARTVRAPVLGLILVALAAVDLFHFAMGYQPQPPPNRVFGTTPPALAYLVRNAGSDRVAGVGDTLRADTGMVYGLRDIRGDDPPFPPKRYLRFFYLGQPPAQATFEPRMSRRITHERLRVLDLLSVRYLIAGRSFKVPDLPAFSTVYVGRDAKIVENRGALPRAFIPERVRLVDGERGAFEALQAPDFDTSRETVVEASRTTGVHAGAGSVRLASEENERVELQVRLRKGGLLVLTDAWAPGWKVTVDGRPAAVLRANAVSRGVQVPAGIHKVVWTYRTPGLLAGLILTAAASVAMISGASLVALRRRARTRLGSTGPADESGCLE